MFKTFLQVLDHERKQVIGVALRVVERAEPYAARLDLARVARPANWCGGASGEIKKTFRSSLLSSLWILVEGF